jgi:hypothetical protein
MAVRRIASMVLAVSLLFLAGTPASAQAACGTTEVPRGSTCVSLPEATDDEIRQHLVRRSIASYSGNCPCPFNFDRAGRRCGARSAYSRPGGASPLCYPTDISAEQRRRAREGGR